MSHRSNAGWAARGRGMNGRGIKRGFSLRHSPAVHSPACSAESFGLRLRRVGFFRDQRRFSAWSGKYGESRERRVPPAERGFHVCISYCVSGRQTATCFSRRRSGKVELALEPIHAATMRRRRLASSRQCPSPAGVSSSRTAAQGHRFREAGGCLTLLPDPWRPRELSARGVCAASVPRRLVTTILRTAIEIGR